MNKYRLTFDPENGQATYQELQSDEVVSTKVVDSDELLNQLIALKNISQVSDSGWLDSRCVRMIAKGSNRSFLLDLPARKVNFNISQAPGIIPDVGLPRLLFVIQGKLAGPGKYRLNNVGLYVFGLADDKALESETELFDFPYGNVFQNGRMCMGNVEYPEKFDSHNLQPYLDLFFQSEFTGHGNESAFGLMKTFFHRKFDSAMLSSADGMTVGKFILSLK